MFKTLFGAQIQKENNQAIHISCDSGLAIGLITITLVLMLLVYPSYLLYDNVNFVQRILAVVPEAVFILLFRKILIKYFNSDSKICLAINLQEFLLPAGLAIIVFLSYLPFWKSSYAAYSDEVYHISAGTLLDHPAILAKYQYFLLGSFLIVISLFFFPKIRVIIKKILISPIPVFVGCCLAVMGIFLIKFFSKTPCTWVIYRFPALGKIYPLFVYLVTGFNEFTFRMPSHLASALTVFPIYFMARTAKASKMLSFMIPACLLFSPVIHFFSGLQYLESLWFLLLMMCFLVLQKSYIETHLRNIYLLFYIWFVLLAFFTRNTALLLPLILICGWFVSLMKNLNWRFIKQSYQIPISAILSMLPMLLWQGLYRYNEYLAYKIDPLKPHNIFRHYKFDISGLFYLEGLRSYWETLNNGLGIFFIVVGILGIIWIIVKAVKSEFHLIVFTTFLGYLLFMLGDYGDWSMCFGYGRFLYMPFVGFAVILALFSGYLSSPRLKHITLIIFLIIFLNYIYSWNKEPSRIADLYGGEIMFYQQEYQKMLKGIKNEKSNDKIGLLLRDGIDRWLMYYTYTFLGKQNLLTFITPPEIKNEAKKQSDQGFYPDVNYIWECDMYPRTLDRNRHQALPPKKFYAPYFFSNSGQSLLLTGAYFGPSNLECRKYCVQRKIEKVLERNP